MNKWIFYIPGGGIFIIVLLLFGSYLITEYQRNVVYQIEVPDLEYNLQDQELIERGLHVSRIRQCQDCHGTDLGGKVTFENFVTGKIVATNLTGGKGGIANIYSDSDLVRAIRHGVNHRGKAHVFMPSDEYTHIDKKDMTALIAYLRSLDPVDNELPESSIGWPARFGHIFLPGVDLFPVRTIDHTIAIPETVENRTLFETGKYLAATCSGCHGKNFSGGRIAGVSADWPDASNITPGGVLENYSAEDFIKSMKTGITPDGRQMNTEYMPWEFFRYMSDDELEGLYIYLNSLPAIQ